MKVLRGVQLGDLVVLFLMEETWIFLSPEGNGQSEFNITV